MPAKSQNVEQPTHHHLYIVVVILVVFALVFFAVTTGRRFTFQDNSSSDFVPTQFRRTTLSDEQAAEKRTFLGDTALTEKGTLTKTEITAKKKILADPLLTKRATQN
jgi:hypothetical protein